MIAVLGLSSSYFAFQGNGIYDSVKKSFDLGFGLAELGAGHRPEKNSWDAVARIKKDFADKRFTVHGLFPPLEKKFWFNASLGLTKQNKGIINGLFKTAQMVEAEVVSIHPGFRKELVWEGSLDGMFEPVPTKEIPLERAWNGFFELAGYALKLARETGCVFAIENLADTAVVPLVFSEEDFENVFERFPDMALLLDVGHGLFMENLPGFLDSFHGKVGQVHLHFSRPKNRPAETDEHRPIASREQLEPLAAIKQFGKIPVVFEHGPKVSREEIAGEKRLVEGFEKRF